MNRSFCACRTAALRIFVRSLAGPSARQPSTLVPAGAHLFTDRRADARGQGSLRTVRERAAAPYSIARFHTARTRYNAQTATVSVTPAEPTGATEPTDSTDTQTTAPSVPTPSSSTEQTIVNASTPTTEIIHDSARAEIVAEIDTSKAVTPEAQDAVQDAAPQMPGKNRRKKLRRQREAEAASAAAEATAPEAADSKDVPAEATGIAGTDIVASSSTTDAGKGTGASTTAGEAVAASVSETATKKKSRADKSTRPQEPKTAKKAKNVTEKRNTTKAKETKEAPKKTSTETKGTEKKKKKEKKQKSESAAQSAARSAAPSPPTAAAEPWQVQKRALREKFQGEAWNPRKKLSPDALEGIRALHAQMPDVYTTPVLAKHFAVSPEAIRRILKSKWQPSVAEEEERQTRWFERGKKVWERWAALGKKPPKRWQAEGIRREKPRRERQQHERTRRQLRAAWQREEMGAMGGMGMLHGGGGEDAASGAAPAADGRPALGGAREPVAERHASVAGREDDGPPHTDRPRQTQSLGKRMRLARRAGHGKE